MPKERRPGDIFLERYVPNASHEKREEARQNLRNVVAALLRIAMRCADEDYAAAIRMKTDGAVQFDGGPIPPL
jgi:hypothetical protein